MKWAIIIYFGFFSLFSVANDSVVEFSKKKIKVGHKKITVEIAESEPQHARGLMFRKKLNTNEGMLFVFSNEQIRSFWMKNTIIDLSVGYFNKEKKLIDIQEMTAATTLMQNELPAYVSKLPAMYALEMPKGWFKKHKISVGKKFQFE